MANAQTDWIKFTNIITNQVRSFDVWMYTCMPN